MAQRAVALCNERYIGIESIYTVVDGKQINIPDKLAALRKLSRNNKLFCPCRCGSNLILVASENNLREQHFRLKPGEFNNQCQAITEGKRSIESKIILKCWLDDKLDDKKIESRVPISDVNDTNRKYEFSFLSREHSIGVSYCHDRINVSDEKLNVLGQNGTGINLVHILDACNFKAEGQYPEAEMKIQIIQGYCLLLDITEETDYFAAELRAVFYARNLEGLWQEVIICDDKLSSFSFSAGLITYGNVPVELLAGRAKAEYNDTLQAEITAREEARKRLAEEAEKQRKEAAKREAELLEQRKLRAEQEKVEREQREIEEKKYIEEQVNQQGTRAVDSHGVRWIKCEFCGTIATESFFTTYGGKDHINLGTCNECNKNNPAAQATIQTDPQSKSQRTKRGADECPRCGGKIVEKFGRFGFYKACCNYPNCTFKMPKR